MFHGMLAALLCLGFGVPALEAQSTTPAPPTPSQGQTDNPFPGEAPQAPAPEKPPSGKSAPQTDSQQPGQSGDSKPKTGSENPFPGEDTDVPIIPVDPGTGAGVGKSADSGAASRPSDSSSGADSASTRRRDADPDGDPVRSPDPLGNVAPDDGFSSSRTGLTQMPAEDDNDGAPGKSTKNKTREQVIKEDVDVGGYYLERKNWKAAQARFTSAFALDAENPDAVWGLAEAERHLALSKKAAEHYKLFLSYDPDGPHGRAARRALEEVEAARPASQVGSKTAGPDSVPSK